MDLDDLNNCLRKCGEPMKYSQKYAISSYDYFSNKLSDDLKQCVKETSRLQYENCLTRVKNTYAEDLEFTKRDYIEYMESLLKRA